LLPFIHKPDLLILLTPDPADPLRKSLALHHCDGSERFLSQEVVSAMVNTAAQKAAFPARTPFLEFKDSAKVSQLYFIVKKN